MREALIVSLVLFGMLSGFAFGVMSYLEMQPYGEQCKPNQEQRQLREIRKILEAA